jgi:hypothetical protein
VHVGNHHVRAWRVEEVRGGSFLRI